jgi:hypothetical protein
VARLILALARSMGAALLLLGACVGDSSPPNGAMSCGVNCGALDAGPDGAAIPPGAVDASDANTSAPGGGGNLPCEVQKLLQSKCQTCHGDPPLFGAYMPLTTQAHFHARAMTDNTRKYYELAKARINASVGAMPPLTAPQLTDSERATLTVWLDQGAPASNERCAVASGPDAGTSSDAGSDAGSDGGPDTTGLDCYKLLSRGDDLKPPYRVGVAMDEYVNVTFAAPWQGTAYGVLIRPIIDNEKIIHHWLLFQDTEPGEPSGPIASNGTHPGGQLLHGWAPGAEAIDFRATGADVGLELPDTTTYTVEFHYNSTDAAATDASGVEICVSKTKPANVAALSWLGYDNLALAGDLGGPRANWSGTCAPTAQQPIHIISVWPHMHLEGRRMTATIQRANGSTETLHDQPFDFNYQILYKKNVTLMPGDTITTDCAYSKPMGFGTGTSDEMCYLFTMAYPKGALVDDGFWGGLAHGGSACLGQ